MKQHQIIYCLPGTLWAEMSMQKAERVKQYDTHTALAVDNLLFDQYEFCWSTDFKQDKVLFRHVQDICLRVCIAGKSFFRHLFPRPMKQRPEFNHVSLKQVSSSNGYCSREVCSLR